MHQCTVIQVQHAPKIATAPRPMVDFLSVMERCRFKNNMFYIHLWYTIVYSITMQPVSLVTPWINIQTAKACKHWAQCSVTAAGTAQCACIPGTSGARCENGPCAKAPCLNSGICLAVGIHAVTDIGFEDVIGLGLKIHFRFQTGSLPVLKFLIYKRSCWFELERAQL